MPGPTLAYVLADYYDMLRVLIPVSGFKYPVSDPFEGLPVRPPSDFHNAYLAECFRSLTGLELSILEDNILISRKVLCSGVHTQEYMCTISRL